MGVMRDQLAACGEYLLCKQCRLRFFLSAERRDALQAKGWQIPRMCPPCLDIPKHKRTSPEDWPA